MASTPATISLARSPIALTARWFGDGSPQQIDVSPIGGDLLIDPGFLTDTPLPSPAAGTGSLPSNFVASRSWQLTLPTTSGRLVLSVFYAPAPLTAVGPIARERADWKLSIRRRRPDRVGANARNVAAVRASAHRLVDAITAGRPDRLCRLLRGQARRYQRCDGGGRDIGPLLNLAIDGRSDIRLVRVGKARAVAHIPSPATHRCKNKSWPQPQTVILRKLGADGWRIVELRLADARCG